MGYCKLIIQQELDALIVSTSMANNQGYEKTGEYKKKKGWKK
jgi:hypothetical protein